MTLTFTKDARKAAASPREVPGPKDVNGAFRILNDKPIRWADKTGLVHAVEGADVHPGVRLLWTLCERDVPAGAAWLLQPGSAHEMCIICMKRAAEPWPALKCEARS